MKVKMKAKIKKQFDYPIIVERKLLRALIMAVDSFKRCRKEDRLEGYERFKKELLEKTEIPILEK